VVLGNTKDKKKSLNHISDAHFHYVWDRKLVNSRQVGQLYVNVSEASSSTSLDRIRVHADVLINYSDLSDWNFIVKTFLVKWDNRALPVCSVCLFSSVFMRANISNYWAYKKPSRFLLNDFKISLLDSQGIDKQGLVTSDTSILWNADEDTDFGHKISAIGDGEDPGHEVLMNDAAFATYTMALLSPDT
jgi:hypothetical protein